MNTFRTVIPPSNFSFKISHNDSLMCLGSCFTEHIGRFLTNSKFSTFINPFGIIYNPLSICKVMNHILDDAHIPASELLHIDDRFFHWDFHGDHSGKDKNETSHLMTKQIHAAHNFIQNANILFLTLGTSNAFQLKKEHRIVANCHKYPNENFVRIELSVAEMVTALQNVITRLQKINPTIRIVFTVSPVRHIRDGLINNQLSKARLLQTAHDLCRDNEGVAYFPSYELVMDDLRDYRFYGEDMIHINDVGLAYIWDYFRRTFFTDETMHKTNRILSIQKDMNHKAFYPRSNKHQKFLKQLKEKIKTIQTEDPKLNFTEEMNSLDRQINI